MKNTLAQGSLCHRSLLSLFRLPEILIEVLPVHPELIHQNPVDKETGVCGGGGEKRRGRDWEVGEVNNSMLHHR